MTAVEECHDVRPVLSCRYVDAGAARPGCGGAVDARKTEVATGQSVATYQPVSFGRDADSPIPEIVLAPAGMAVGLPHVATDPTPPWDCDKNGGNLPAGCLGRIRQKCDSESYSLWHLTAGCADLTEVPTELLADLLPVYFGFGWVPT
jgi:hypothetical protein